LAPELLKQSQRNKKQVNTEADRPKVDYVTL